MWPFVASQFLTFVGSSTKKVHVDLGFIYIYLPCNTTYTLEHSSITELSVLWLRKLIEENDCYVGVVRLKKLKQNSYKSFKKKSL